MRGIRLVPENTNVSFIQHKSKYFMLSVIIMLSSIGIFLTNGLNYGIDFKGGILIEIRTEQAADIVSMRSQLGGLGLGEVSLQEFGEETEVLIRIQKQDGDEKAQQIAVEAVKVALGEGIEYRRTEVVGPKVSDELFWDGLYAVGLAIFAILFYIWIRFEWQFGVGAVIALTHDVIATIGVFALLGLEFNLTTVAAILTIAGYSINDTVVLYDRVRENLRKYKTRPLDDLLNGSVNETLARTVMTSVTTLIALSALYFLGSAVIRDFSFAMIFGVIIGTYSSICLAVPALLHMDLNRNPGEDDDEKQAVNSEA